MTGRRFRILGLLHLAFLTTAVHARAEETITARLAEPWLLAGRQTVDGAEDALMGLTRYALNDGVHALCVGADLTSRFPKTCGTSAPPSHASMAALRAAMIHDAVALASRLAPQLVAPTGRPSPLAHRAIAAVTLLAAMLESADPLTWGVPIRGLGEQFDTCGASRAECLELGQALHRVGDILTAVAVADERLRVALETGPDAFVAELARVVDVTLGPLPQRDPAETLAFVRERLAGPVKDMLLLRRAVSEARAEADPGARRRAYAAAAGQGLECLSRLWSASSGLSPFPLSPETAKFLRQLAEAAADRDASAVLELFAPYLREIAVSMSLPPEAPAALAVLADLATARTEAEVRQRLRSALLPVPAWAEPLVLDVNAHWPRLESGEIRVNGDLTVGYNGDAFGLVFRGSALTYDLSSASGFTQTDRFEGAVEAWWVFRPSPRLALELRGTGQGALYDSTVVDLKEDLLLGDETSVMARGTVLVGLRSNPTARWAVGVWGGAGLQYEYHDALTLQRDTTTLADDEPITMRAEGRAHLQFDAWPQVLSLRARSDFNLLRISHDAGRIVVGGGASDVTSERTTLQQVELLSRFMVDFDLFDFFDLRPSIHAGINSVIVEDLATHAFVVGAGIRREAF